MTDSEYYDINSDYHDKAFSIFVKEEIDAANRYAEYWYYTNQFNTIPADVKSKDNGYKSILRSWIEYQTKPIPQETFKRWKSLGLFAFGIAVITGEIHRGENKGSSLVLLDIDTQEALEKFEECIDRSIDDISRWTRVEWHKEPWYKYHIYIIVKGRKFNDVSAGLGLEVHATEKYLAFVSNSMHPSGNRWECKNKDNESIAVFSNSIDIMTLETAIDMFMTEVSKGQRSFCSKDQTDEYMDYINQPGIKLTKGQRYPATWAWAKSLFFKYTGDLTDDVKDDIRYQKLVERHNEVCTPPLFEERGRELDVETVWRTIHRLFTGKRQKERDDRADKKKQAEEESKKYASNMCERKKDIVAKLPEGVGITLLQNIWTRVSENPLKFIIARRKEGDICRASVLDHKITVGYNPNSSAIEQKIHYISYGATVFRVFPIKVTLHESPLAFLEAPPTYSIVFEGQKNNKQFTMNGSIEQITQQLKEMPGCVVNAYGINEVLAAIIGAFEDDGNLIVDKSVDFEGYYYADGDIYTSKIDFDLKHLIRTKEEAILCIQYINERAKYQIWEYNGRIIDRRDVYASALKWAVPAPFNFIIKQLSPSTLQRYHKAFDMTGEYDGGKSGLSQEMLTIHGNGTGQKNASSIYSVPAGSANTDAKLGKIVSRTTYPVVISEIRRIETYGRDESLVETLKNAIENVKVRDGRKENRYDVPFPGCSALILNGNSPISKKSELIKRMHVIGFSQEDRHSLDPNSPFNQFQSKNGHLIKILGDWTMRYILEHKKELLLSGKYDSYEIGEITLKAFYDFAGVQYPDWLNLWVKDTSLEDLDVDEKSLVRSILNEHINKTLIGKGANDIPLLWHRIEKIIDGEWWSFIRRGNKTRLNGRTKEGRPKYDLVPTDNCYIDASILEIFRHRLPDLTFKKLCNIMGKEPTQDHDGKQVIKLTKRELSVFIYGDGYLEDGLSLKEIDIRQEEQEQEEYT